jgi:hypothetical protein
MFQLNTCMKMIGWFTCAAAVALVLVGCVSEAVRIQQDALRRESLERAARVKQNWSKLHEGLSLEEVDTLVGPIFDAETKAMMRSEQEFGEYVRRHGGQTQDSFTYKTDLYTLQFRAGQLKAWRLNR